jgi:hypothetical protein
VEETAKMCNTAPEIFQKWIEGVTVIPQEALKLLNMQMN